MSSTGKMGHFVRIKQVMRPNDAQAPLFSLSESPAVAEGKRLSVSTLVQPVNNHLQKISTKIPVEVRENVTDLGYPENGAKGITVGGKIYLFRDRLTSLADARDTLFHELFHLGVRRFLTQSEYATTISHNPV